MSVSFSPVVNIVNEQPEYTFQIPGTGQFHCKETGLVFETTGEGEVLYKSVYWPDRQIQSTGGIPAGPLFDIQCPQESVCQLRLQHCAITPGDDLRVVNVTDEGLRLLKPQEVTQTHVVLNVTHVSSQFGLLWKKYNYSKAIYGQVLLFLQEPGRRTRRLNASMVPANVHLREVLCFYQYVGCMKEKLMTTFNCELIPDQRYKLQCEHQEESCDTLLGGETYRLALSYGPNYHPMFRVVVPVQAEEVSVSFLGPKDNQIWKDTLEIDDARPPIHIVVPPREAVEALLSVKAEFVKRVPEDVTNHLLDTLLDEKIILDEELETIMAEKVREEKARKVIELMILIGNDACLRLISALREELPSLHQELGLDKS